MKKICKPGNDVSTNEPDQQETTLRFVIVVVVSASVLCFSVSFTLLCTPCT